MVRRRVVRALAPAAVLWLANSRPLHAQHVGLVPVAEAYTAAWNARDLEAVLALFAPDAVVRQRRGEVPAAVWDTRDPQVVSAYLGDSRTGDSYDTGGLVWAMGHRQITAWAAGRFAQHHRFAIGPPRAAGDTVGWRYREFVDPYQLVPGVGPAEGEAAAVVRGGRIAVLSFVQSPDSVLLQRDEMSAAATTAAATMAARHAALSGAEPGIRSSGLRSGVPTAESPDAAWPLALSGLALLSALVVARRRRQRP